MLDREGATQFPEQRKADSYNIAKFAFSNDNKTLVSVAHGVGSWTLWERATGKPRATGGTGIPGFTSLDMHPNGRMFATTTDNTSTINLWDLVTCQRVATLQAGKRHLTSLSFSPTGKTLAVGTSPTKIGGEVLLWDTTRRELKSLLKGHQSEIVSLSFRPDGKMLASSSADGTIELWDLTTNQTSNKNTPDAKSK
ncbi:MAG: WD40 repeat domain-containing protein [Gemmataceae bacterium]